MKYFTIAPTERLAKYVRYYWVLEGEASPEQPYIYRSMADGCAELIFHYNGIFDELMTGSNTEKSVAAGLATPSQTFRRFSIPQNFGIFGVYLYPYAVGQLFGIKGADLKNQLLDLKTVLGAAANELEEKMMLSNCNAERVKIISTFLENSVLHDAQQQPGIFESIRYILQTNDTANVAALAKQHFLSTRQFQRNFKDATGMSPKTFSRIVRFQTALAQYQTKDKTLTQIAYECGYYDQSHFIQDFKEFSGHNPKAYFYGCAEGTEWRDV